MRRLAFITCLFVFGCAPWTLHAAEKILVIGDSLSAAYGIKQERGWVALLQQRLQEQALGYQVVNASISGDTTRGGLSRLQTALQREKPQLLIIALGGNDGLRAVGRLRVDRWVGRRVGERRRRRYRPGNRLQVRLDRVDSESAQLTFSVASRQ